MEIEPIIDASTSGEKAGFQERRKIISAMFSDSVTPEQAKKITDCLAGYDNEILEKLHGKGVRIDIKPPEEVNGKNKTLRGILSNLIKGYSWNHETGACYDPGSKTVTLASDNINPQVLKHELAHALDHVQSGGSGKKAIWHSLKDPEFQKLYDAYLEGSGGNKDSDSVWDHGYSLSNKRDYFAQGVAYYKTPGLRDNLKAKDPGLYAYLKKVVDG